MEWRCGGIQLRRRLHRFAGVEGAVGSFVLSLSNIVPGCNDATACNFDVTANINDGSCDYSCIGCIDPIALNYNPDATLDEVIART